MRECRKIFKRSGAAQAALGRCTLACLLLLAAVPAFSVVKSSGTVEISDDLAAGFAGSVDMTSTGGNIVLSGSLGQVAVSQGSSLGGAEVESGYFSKYASTPAALGVGSVFSSSTTVAGTGGIVNPSATLYEIQTSPMQDFSGGVVSVSSVGWPAPLTGLNGNTTYYTRLRASYLGEDYTQYTPAATFQTLPAMPEAQGFIDVFSSSLTMVWGGSANAPGTRYYAQIGTDPGFTAGNYVVTVGSPVSIGAPPPLNYEPVTAGRNLALVSLEWTDTEFNFQNPQNFRAIVRNTGNTAESNVAVTMQLGGLSAQDSPKNIAAINSGELSTQSFTAFMPAGQNEGLAVACIDLVDDNLADNCKTIEIPSLSHTFGGLSPNTTYFVRLKAIGDLGDETGFVLFGSTITTAVTPSTTVPCAVSSVTLTAYWSPNGNPAGTVYRVQYSTDGFATVQGSSETRNAYAHFTGLAPNTTHYVRAASLNFTGAPSLFTALPDALTSAAPPLKRADTFPTRSGFSVDVQWLGNANPASTEYLAEVSTAADFTAAETAGPGWSPGVAITAAGLEPVTLYYFRAKARNAAGLESAYEDLGSTSTLTGVDITSPTITDSQDGDMNWRSSNTAVYNIDLADSGGSYLNKLQVRASTGLAGTGTVAFNWSDAVTNINANAYTANWGLTSAQWGLLPSGTSYISLRAWDGAGNYRELEDPFYILKDTAAPTIADNQTGETTWRKTDPGAIYQVNFYDAPGGAGLSAVEYSASNTAGAGNGNLLAWTPLAGLMPGATYYNGPWAVNFTALTSGVTNYISVRATDLAGNTASVTDAFLVLKNVSGPEVRLTAPYAGSHSALAAVSGTAAPVLEYAISGTEITLQERNLFKYWDGAAFTSATPLWLKASGGTAWTYDTSGIAWASGTQYQVVARSSDTALNYSLPYATGTFTFDTSVPVAFVSAPAADSTLETPALIAGTAADSGPDAGVPYVALTLRRKADMKWWNFFTGAWGEAVISTMTAGGAAWSFSPDGALRGNLLDGGTYYVYAAARDGAMPPNESPAGLYASTFTVRDTVPPGAITVSSAAQGALPGRLLVTWTAAGDDGAAATLAQGFFAINYSTWAGAAYSTASAQVLISTGGVAPGAAQAHLVSGLLPGVTYYLALWTADEAGQWSAQSSTVAGRAGISLADSISGNVWTPSGQGVTGVMVQAIDRDLAVVQVTYTVDDGSGAFTLSGLAEGIYRVQATWLENGFASSVASDQIPTGYAEARFELSVDYQLASIGGELAGYGLSALGYRASAAGPQAAVELYQGSRLVAVAPVGAGGRFLISGLLPGAYSLKVPDGAGGHKLLQVTLAPGQDLRISPLGDLLRGGDVYVYPNPASRLARFHLKTDQDPVLKLVNIFDITGRLVHKLENASFTQLTFAAPFEWRAEWSIPAKVAPGVYIYSAQLKNEATGEHSKAVKKFAIVK